STGMAAVAKEKLVDEGIVEEVSLICGDVIKAPFKADHFDKIFMSFTLELFDTPEISGVLGEIRRMMKDGGRLGVVSLSKEEDIFVKGYEVFHEIFPTLLDCRPIPVEDILKKEGFKIDSSMSERIGMIPLKIASAYQL
ncbi:MAG: class I SAM-dependent methyltransferase, partial [Candidatus Aenigmatarchaeota archaeon]